MAMEAKDIAELFETYGVDFFAWFFGLLKSPIATVAAAPSRNKQLVFLIFCALIGATLGSLIPGRPPISDRSTVAVTVVALWTFTSVIIHFVCRILRGKGEMENTVLSMLQILAVAYVVSNFVTMVITSAEVVLPQARTILASSGLETPGDIILLLQFIMLLIYTPLILKAVHKFQGAIVGVLVGLLAAGIAVLLAAPVAGAGHC